MKQRQKLKFLFWPPPKNQDLSTSHDLPNKLAIDDLLIRLKKNLTCTSGNLLSLWWGQNKDIGASFTDVTHWVTSHQGVEGYFRDPGLD